MRKGFFLLFTLASILFIRCNSSQDKPAQFQLLRKDATHLDFHNVLRQTPEFNVFTYMYFFNGGGLAAGDFNNDGLIDLYFTSNMGANKLFLNEGKLKFKDVTGQAGVAGIEGWTTGASVVDINNDGLLDIYVSQMGDYLSIKGQNQLYVCQGIKDGVPFYQDEAMAYGLQLVGFGTQAAFFDYDLDGDLDMYQLNHSLHQNGTFGQKKQFEGKQHPLAGDKLMRNDFIPPPGGGTKGGFTEVTMQAGINSTVIGYGLGIATGDINLDGWPDIYIGNDFHENDYLYINTPLKGSKGGEEGKGGERIFKESLTGLMAHTSRFSMGVDMADLNNDAWNEVISLDMMPEDPFILKTSLGEDGYDLFRFKMTYGYNSQFARNNLQLNTPLGGGREVAFSEIALFAGVHATDWSWAPLFLDFDDDGYKDLFISNGIHRRMNDIDYVNYRADHELRFKEENNALEESDLVVVEKMPQIKLPNKFFRNAGNPQALKFDDLQKQIGGNLPTYSNGAIYADLDNDGDLDLVVNNIEDEPFVYKNLTSENGRGGNNSYLSLQLKGPPANLGAIGARVVVFKKGQKVIYENFPVRGYQSSMLAPLHIGIGDTSAVDSVLVIWPDRTWQRLEAPRYNSALSLAWKENLPRFDFDLLKPIPAHPFQFADATDELEIDFRHKENPFVEFNRERLIPGMVSSEGPALAVGDVNGDGLEDVFLGSSKRERSALYFQKPGGGFYENTPLEMIQDSIFEDVDAVFADLDNDGDLDLAVAAGGNEYKGQDEAMKQRAYLNDGKGNFRRIDFPGVYMTASCVLPADFNRDGLVDFFFGARAVPWNYGITPTSALMLNKGNGRFENVTEQYSKELSQAGLVKNGAWADMDGDGDLDLVLAIEWEPVTIFLNEGGHFTKQPINGLTGWWNFVLLHDFDGDGDVDILAGNLGENSKLKPSSQAPVKLYVNDFDNNGQIEQILTYHLGGREIPFATFEEITKQMPPLKKKFLFAKDFAKASITEIFGKEKLDKAILREANTFQSMYFENTGKGFGFKAHRLPDPLQFSTLNAAWLADLDGNGKQEVVLGGNFYDCNIEMGRYDADYGNVLSISKDGAMTVFPLGDLAIKGQVRKIRPVAVAGKTCFILAKNDGFAQIVRPVFTGDKLTSH